MAKNRYLYGTRKFGNVPFQYVRTVRLKSEANQVANELRKSGFYTRIVKHSDGYAIFMRVTGLRRK